MATSRDPFVGRREDLALLRRRLADVRAGSGRLVLVGGPAGVGKTRLIEEVVATAGGVPAGWGATVDNAGMPALWPRTRALRGMPAPGEALTAVVREAVYASLPPVRRAALHRRAAELLEPLAIARDERAGAVAHHWYRAGEPARAVVWAVRAADAARAAAAYEEAVSYLELALTAIDQGSIDRADGGQGPHPPPDW